MAIKINPEATWQELGMRIGIKVPGTSSWMARWRKEPNQKWMIDYAQAVEILFRAMSEKKVDQYIQLYLSGKWDPGDEAIIAAAIRRTPIIEGKYNLMEMEVMSKKKDKSKTAVKKAEAEDQGKSLKERIEALEEEVEKLNKRLDEADDGLEERFKELEDSPPEKPSGPRGKKKAKAEAASDDTAIAGLLKELAQAKEDEDKKEAFKIRVKLRKAGYSLRANGKK